jgi:predicted histone-like DNA-binding protein
MLRYKVIKQQNALDENKKEMYYPRLTKRSKYTTSDVADLIRRRSTLSKADIIATLVSLEEVISEMLKEGSIVDLGGLGTFSLQANASSAPTEGEVTWRSFQALKTRFRPGKALKIDLLDVHFTKV